MISMFLTCKQRRLNGKLKLRLGLRNVFVQHFEGGVLFARNAIFMELRRNI